MNSLISAGSPSIGVSSNLSTTMRTPFLLRHYAASTKTISRNIVEKNALPLRMPLAGVGSREHEKMVHDAAKPARLVLNRAKRRLVALFVARVLQRDVGVCAQNRDRGFELVGGVCHEAAHVRHRCFNRRDRFSREHASTHRNEHNGDERGSRKRPDQIGITIFQLEPDRRWRLRSIRGPVEF